MWLLVIVVVALGGVLLKLYAKITTGWCTNYVCMVGKTALVTGGNSGLGYQTALALAGKGCRVIIADKDNCDKSKRRIIEETGNNNIVFKYFDLASLTSIRELARDINETEERLDVLINNAGTAALGNSYTNDGLHVGMQVNHFGSFLLTHLLVGLLKKSAPSRIVFVSSVCSFLSIMDSEDLNLPASQITIYNNSKLCNIITANTFARKLKGTGVTVNSLHPGVVSTPIYKKYTHGKGSCVFLNSTLYFGYLRFIKPFSKTAVEGAQTTIHLATAKELEDVTGEHFWDCKVFTQPNKAKNPKFCNEIWEISENLVKLLPEEKLET